MARPVIAGDSREQWPVGERAGGRLRCLKFVPETFLLFEDVYLDVVLSGHLDLLMTLIMCQRWFTLYERWAGRGGSGIDR